MPSEFIGEYEIEYTGVHLVDGEGWAAYVTVYGPSTNPMHRTPLFPYHRVAVETVFPTEQAAEEEAREIARSLLK
ncbi:hypothetical protein GCM10027343_21730 [Noviherbaspirillum agri]